MNRTIFSLLATLVLLGSPGDFALAQGSSARPPVGGGLTSAGATATAKPITKPISEPAEMSGMLAAQNEARARLGVPTLAWSPTLSVKAAETATAAAGGSCPVTAARRAGETDKASIFWAAGLRRVGGVMSAQDISPAYLVSRWREGSADYNIATGQCRSKSGNCEPFSRMVAPKAKTVGCARAICPNQTQVWACLYKE
ncbi:MAG: hypothetical protein IPO30_04835 [Hyphomonadaceae bacterium]|nr:hypothetical protein [Hyphomonadaceae bacterium]MBP9234262.1 hypothetical protein [Hyphomonadaceae bacterium]